MSAAPARREIGLDPQLLSYYEAIERASADMLSAARAGNWDEVVKLEGACVLLISQLKNAAQEPPPAAGPGDAAAATRFMSASASTSACTSASDSASAFVSAASHDLRQAQQAARIKSRIMQRILVNDAEIRHLAEPWLQDLDDTLAGRSKTLH